MGRYLWSHISFRGCVCPGVGIAGGWWVCLEVDISKGGGYVQEGLVGFSGPMSIIVDGCVCPGVGIAEGWWVCLEVDISKGGGYVQDVLVGFSCPMSIPVGGCACPSGRYASYWNTCLFLTVPIQPTGFIVMRYLELCYEYRNWTTFNSFVVNILYQNGLEGGTTSK